MRVMVTGGAGYIGSVVVEELVRDGHEVTVYDNLSKGHAECVPSGTSFYQADLLETDCLRDSLREKEVETTHRKTRRHKSWCWVQIHWMPIRSIKESDCGGSRR